MRFTFRYWCIDHFYFLCPVNNNTTMPEYKSTKSRLKDKYHRPNKLRAKIGKKHILNVNKKKTLFTFTVVNLKITLNCF